MNEMILPEDSHVDNIFQVASYEAPMPSRAKESFLPWHRPRKQFVRHCQWVNEIKALIKNRTLSDNTLKYLGLPGVDLLDLRHFHSTICLDSRVKLRFLGFNSSAQPNNSTHTELNISLDEVKRLENIDPRSNIIGDSFALVANKNSIAYRNANELGPYDVINLDLCDGFCAKPPGEKKNNYYDAVVSLLTIQARNANPWLLFLTTRTDKANIDESVLKALINKYCDNLNQCNSFQEKSHQLFSIDTADSVTQAVGEPLGLFYVFLTGLCKWFITLALEYKPPMLVKVKSIVGYRVENEAEVEDLVSLVFEFKPRHQVVSDPIGLATQPVDNLDEGVLATNALSCIATRKDVDMILRTNTELMQKMTDSTAELLRLARYDANKYMEWVSAYYVESPHIKGGA